MGMGSLELGEVAGFSITVPNCEKAVGVSSSMGMRMDGLGMEGGMVPGWVASSRATRRARGHAMGLGLGFGGICICMCCGLHGAVTASAAGASDALRWRGR